jgi:RNA polymerase subunit RPABC4/transcription elongation factor Spt4
MLCDQCRRNIADDSVYCSYCGAHQPTPDAQTNSPNFEPYVPA